VTTSWEGAHKTKKKTHLRQRHERTGKSTSRNGEKKSLEKRKEDGPRKSRSLHAEEKKGQNREQAIGPSGGPRGEGGNLRSFSGEALGDAAALNG